MSLIKKDLHFVSRFHKSMLNGPVSELCPCGKTDTAKLFEQRVRLTLEGESLLIK